MQVEQVLMNLCMNARQAINGRGKIGIKSANRRLPNHLPNDQLRRANPNACGGEFVELTVSDNGRGMDEATLARIFEPFFHDKGCWSRNRPRAGHGLRYRQQSQRLGRGFKHRR